MNIIYDDTILNIQKYGGVSRYFSKIIGLLKKYNNVNIEIAKVFWAGLPWKLKKLNDIFLNLRLDLSRSDIYHPTYYSNLVKKRGNVKTVVTVYDMIHELYAHKFAGLNSGIEIKKRSILNADHLICISNNCKKDLQNFYGIENNRISVIYLGVCLSHADASEGINKKSACFKKPYILYVGNRKYHKNFDLLMKAFFILGIKDSFDLICFGADDFSQDEISGFKKMDLINSVRHVNGDDRLLYLYYKHADIFVYPSFYEGFGLPVLEAMANSCPVVASNAGSIPEIAGNAALLFSPYNVNELCSCIKLMLNGNDMKKEYVKRGSERAKGFSWEKTAEETYHVYNMLLNS